MHFIGIWHNFRMNSQMIQNAEQHWHISICNPNQYQAQNGISRHILLSCPLLRRNHSISILSTQRNLLLKLFVLEFVPFRQRGAATFTEGNKHSYKHCLHRTAISISQVFLHLSSIRLTQSHGPLLFLFRMELDRFVELILLETAGMSKSLRKMCRVQCQFILFSMMKSIHWL